MSKKIKIEGYEAQLIWACKGWFRNQTITGNKKEATIQIYEHFHALTFAEDSEYLKGCLLRSLQRIFFKYCGYSDAFKLEKALLLEYEAIEGRGVTAYYGKTTLDKLITLYQGEISMMVINNYEMEEKDYSIFKKKDKLKVA